MQPKTREKFTVAIICALVHEAEAIEAYFDEIYDRFARHYGKNKGDRNCYLNGRMGKHEVVLCYMPGMGKGSAAMVASDLRFSYTNIELVLVVGICGGAPKPPNREPIFLGDAIIGDSIIAYDFGKQYPDGFRRKRDAKDVVGKPSHELRTVLSGLSVSKNRTEFQDQMADHLREAQQADSRWNCPTSDDILFESSYPHKHHSKPDPAHCVCSPGDTSDKICDGATRIDCASLGCEEGRISRRRQQTELGIAVVHIGKFASADTVMKSALHRDELAETEEVIAFEMEGAGVCDSFPCIVIKGVSDYADSHKDKKWQLYAAANAAAAAKTFLGYVNPISKTERSIQWMVPFRRNPKFVGRQDQIQRLRALISDPDGPRELAITGLGGVGKTQVALEVAYQIRDDDPKISIFWIPCTSLESVEQGYADIARRLELPGEYDAKKEVQTYLSQSTSEKWLLIFDNADNEDMWIKSDNGLQAFVPENEHGRTLFTSRNEQLALDLTDSNVIALPEYDIDTGLEFLKRSLRKHDLVRNHDTATQLLEQLMLLPLAITQAVAYINKNQITMNIYLEMLKKQESEIIEVLSEDFQDRWRYKDIQNPVATTWWISFQQIQQSNPLAAEYLTFMACINPRNIPQCMLLLNNSENDRIKAIGLLKSYAFVSDCEQAQHRLLSIHRLVHIATRNWMRSQKMIDSQIIKALNVLEKTLPQPRSRLIPETWRIYLPHVLYVLKEECVQEKQSRHGTLVGAMSECLAIDLRLKEAEVLCINFIHTIDTPNVDDEGVWRTVRILTSISRLPIFDATGTRVATQFLDLVTTRAPKKPICKWLRALSYLNLQRHDDATKTISEAMECLGLEDLWAMDFQASTAAIYQSQKRYKESENAYLQVIKTVKSILGPDHYTTLRYQEGLAMLYHDAGKCKEAEDLYLSVIQASETSLLTCSYHKLDYQFNLALIYTVQKRYEKAEQIMTQVIESRQQVQGPNDFDIVMDLISLAIIYIEWKRMDKAEGALLQLKEYRQICPDSNPFVNFNDIARLRKWIHLTNKLIEIEKRVAYHEKRVSEMLLDEKSSDRPAKRRHV